jgi:ABC-type branched-subunit amino acid transport system permease subunit
MTMFWTGLAIGAVVGTTFGVVLMGALLRMSKDYHAYCDKALRDDAALREEEPIDE